MEILITPPSPQDSPAIWAQWLAKNERKASAAKAAVTRKLEYVELDTVQETVKIGGQYVQASRVGLGGDWSEGQGTLEPVVDAPQDKDAALSDMERCRNKRGGSRKGKSARRRRNRKARSK